MSLLPLSYYYGEVIDTDIVLDYSYVVERLPQLLDKILSQRRVGNWSIEIFAVCFSGDHLYIEIQ